MREQTRYGIPGAGHMPGWMCIVIVLLSGCTTMPQIPAETARADWHPMAIAPAQFGPASNFRSFANDVAKGAATGAGVGIIVTAPLIASSPMILAVAPYIILSGAASGAIGPGAAGLSASASPQDIQSMTRIIDANFAKLNIPDTLARQLAAITERETGHTPQVLAGAGPQAVNIPANYQVQAEHGIRTVLEIAALETGFVGGKELSFFLVARVRLVEAGTGNRIYEHELVYVSDARKARHWADNDATELAQELQRAYTAIAENAVNRIFLETALPIASSMHTCGLAALRPERVVGPDLTRSPHTWSESLNRYRTLDNRQPTLEWERFPRTTDRHANSGVLLENITNIHYDLRLWKIGPQESMAPVLDLRELPEPVYTLPQPLDPASRYFWSVRARFELNGTTRATTWSYHREPYYYHKLIRKTGADGSVVTTVPLPDAGLPRDPCLLDFIPTANYYRFQTPAEQRRMN